MAAQKVGSVAVEGGCFTEEPFENLEAEVLANLQDLRILPDHVP